MEREVTVPETGEKGGYCDGDRWKGRSLTAHFLIAAIPTVVVVVADDSVGDAEAIPAPEHVVAAVGWSGW